MERATQLQTAPSLQFADGQEVQFDRPWVMGVINCSPNSFYQAIATQQQVLELAEQMVADGVDIIDIGGEATNIHVNIEREAVSVENEIQRVVPAISQIKSHFNIRVSVDTSQPRVMQAAIDAGVDLINDQRALKAAGALEVVARANVPACLMHFPYQRIPGSSTPAQLMQQVVADLSDDVARCEQAGMTKNQLLVDPGFGTGNYGKNTHENFYLLKHLNELKQCGCPILAGWSRKSMIGDVLGGVTPDQRLYGSVAAVTLATLQGAQVIRVHDVKPTVDAMKVTLAMLRSTS